MYVCPTCKGELKQEDERLRCPACGVSYPIIEGIPDFVLEDLTQSAQPILRRVKALDRLARIYETKLWYPVVLNLYGGFGSTSLAEIRRMVSGCVTVEQGLVLDVACGPGTLGRSLASPARTVYGTDISAGMLRQGVAYAQQEGIANLYFARAKAEALPFPAGLFDAAICGGALHLFGDPVAALREIGRTMKSGAPLVVTTFVAGGKGLLRFRRVRERLRRKGVHVFQTTELEQYLSEAGFESFQFEAYGSVLGFRARKAKEEESPGGTSSRT